MGVSVFLQADDLRCRSEVDARVAAAIINSSALSPYYLQVIAAPSHQGDLWRLQVEHFQGDHWHDEVAQQVWIATAPHMADGASVRLEGEGGVPWRIRWQDGRVFEDAFQEVLWTPGPELSP